MLSMGFLPVQGCLGMGDPWEGLGKPLKAQGSPITLIPGCTQPVGILPPLTCSGSRADLLGCREGGRAMLLLAPHSRAGQG